MDMSEQAMSRPSTTSKTVDLDEIVRDWAWETLLFGQQNPTRRMQRLVKKERRSPGQYIKLEVDWSKVVFSDITKWRQPKLMDEAFSDDASNTQVGHHNSIADTTTPAGPGGFTKAAVLFQTKFTNDTKKPQQYTMSAEKTTSSSCTTEIESSYTRGLEMSVKLATPGELFEANVGYTRELELTRAQGQTLDEVVTWSVESQIQVEAENVAEATLEVTERKKSGDFKVHTTVEGRVGLTFTNLRDNNSLLIYTTYSLFKIVNNYLKIQSDLKKDVPYLKVNGEKVEIITEGRCFFRYGIEQEVHVIQKKINTTNPSGSRNN